MLFGCSNGGAAPENEVKVTKAVCGVDDIPEENLQGQVSAADRESGRNLSGYRCNLELVGQYQGEGSSWVSPSSSHCAYMPTSFFGLLTKKSPGVQIIDVSDPAQPALAKNLVSPSMLIGPWESLKVNESRKLLGAVSVGPLIGGGFFDVYDIGEDCANPRHLNGIGETSLELPSNLLGHEGNWSPDGQTYWASGLAGGSLTAIDVSDPTRPHIIYTGIAGFPANHGVELSDDGNRLYLGTIFPAGVIILDISDIQSRKKYPTVRQISSISWKEIGVNQHAFPVRYGSHRYLIAADEFGAEGVRIIDIENETNPQIVSHIQLEIQMEGHEAERAKDSAGNGLFGYDAHYCDTDRRVNPTALACGFFQSGVRVFDIRDVQAPKEIAYFNPPPQAQARARLAGSEHASGLGLLPTLAEPSVNAVTSYVFDLGHLSDANLSTDWCTSPPRFVGEQIWVTCQDNGFMVLGFTNGAYPLK
jgi:hypothetical protein